MMKDLKHDLWKKRLEIVFGIIQIIFWFGGAVLIWNAKVTINVTQDLFCP